MCLVILFNSRAVSGSTPLSATITIIQLKTIKSEAQKSLLDCNFILKKLKSFKEDSYDVRYQKAEEACIWAHNDNLYSLVSSVRLSF